MTVCIGAICNKGNSAVVISDRMVTTGYPPIEFEHNSAKIEKINDRCLMLTAGDALKSRDLVQLLKTKVASLQDPPIAQIVEECKKSYEELRLKLVEENWLFPRGLNFEFFYKQRGILNLPPDLAMLLDREMVKFNYGVEILIGGIDNGGSHIYGIRNPGISDCYDKLGYHSVGIGYIHAISTLISHSYCPELSLNESVYVTYEAKKNAEVAPGVGVKTDIAIISSNGISFLNETEKNELESTRAKVTKPRTKEFESCVSQLSFEKKVKNESTK